MKLDPKHLAQLSQIVETGSFQEAAEKTGLTQPALSRNMRTLEKRVGSSLFTRDGRRSVPNTLGRKLARSGLSIRLAEETASNVIEQADNETIGELRIGAPPIVAGRFLTQALSRFIKENPMSSVLLRTGLVPELRTMLERGQIDLIFGPRGLADARAGLEFMPLIDDRVSIMCRTGHPLTDRKITPGDLETYPWVAHSRGSLLRQQTEAAMMASGLDNLQIAFETDSIRSVLEIVAATDMLTSMPKVSTSLYLEDKLQFLEFDHPQFHRPLGAVRRQDFPPNELEDSFLEIVDLCLNEFPAANSANS